MATNNEKSDACGAGPNTDVVVECEEHGYGKWRILTVLPTECLEIRSCVKCGTSQVRSMERVAPIACNVDHVICKRKDVEHLERLCDKKIDRINQ